MYITCVTVLNSIKYYEHILIPCIFIIRPGTLDPHSHIWDKCYKDSHRLSISLRHHNLFVGRIRLYLRWGELGGGIWGWLWTTANQMAHDNLQSSKYFKRKYWQPALSSSTPFGSAKLVSWKVRPIKTKWKLINFFLSNT